MPSSCIANGDDVFLWLPLHLLYSKMCKKWLPCLLRDQNCCWLKASLVHSRSLRCFIQAWDSVSVLPDSTRHWQLPSTEKANGWDLENSRAFKWNMCRYFTKFDGGTKNKFWNWTMMPSNLTRTNLPTHGKHHELKITTETVRFFATMRSRDGASHHLRAVSRRLSFNNHQFFRCSM